MSDLSRQSFPAPRLMLSRPAFHLWSRCIALACLAGPAVGGGPDWPQWRGPAGDGHAPAAHDLPVAWSETEHVAWKTPLPGRGWSSPVIGGGQVWVTTAIEREASPEEQARRLAGNRMAGQLAVSGPVTIRAVCLDQTTGRILHDVELFTIPDPQPIHKLNSYASPSPVLAAGRLYCHCGDFGAACIDTASGRLLWTNRELRLNHENGPGSTPVVWQIVHLDGSDVQSIAAYDTATGRIAWQTPRSGPLRDDPQLKKAYGTPGARLAGGRLALCLRSGHGRRALEAELRRARVLDRAPAGDLRRPALSEHELHAAGITRREAGRP